MSILATLIPSVVEIIGKVIPDPAAKAAAQLELLRLQQAGEFKEIDTGLALALGQVEINKIEAASDDLLKSGWRPAVGWVCVAGLVYTYVAQPLLTWLSLTRGWATPPDLDNSQLMILLGGMLGFGGLRSFDKAKGTA